MWQFNPATSKFKSTQTHTRFWFSLQPLWTGKNLDGTKSIKLHYHVSVYWEEQHFSSSSSSDHSTVGSSRSSSCCYLSSGTKTLLHLSLASYWRSADFDLKIAPVIRHAWLPPAGDFWQLQHSFSSWTASKWRVSVRKIQVIHPTWSKMNTSIEVGTSSRLLSIEESLSLSRC